MPPSPILSTMRIDAFVAPLALALEHAPRRGAIGWSRR